MAVIVYENYFENTARSPDFMGYFLWPGTAGNRSFGLKKSSPMALYEKAIALNDASAMHNRAILYEYRLGEIVSKRSRIVVSLGAPSTL